MDLTAVIASFNATQAAFATLAALQLTAYLFPPNVPVYDGAVYDYVVVGAGTAGSIVASRLSEIAENRVLLIEAGGDPPLESIIPGLLPYLYGTQYDWNITSTGGPAEQCHQQHRNFIWQGRMLGGSSSNNYMAYNRGNVHDYDQYATIANDLSWTWNNVLPYFKKAERLMDYEIMKSKYGAYYGTKGNLGVTRPVRPELEKYLDAFHEAGEDTPLDINAGHNLGYVQPTYTIADGTRQSSAYGYLRPAAHRHNLDVLKNTLVTRIIFDKHRRAIGVKALTERHKTINIKATKEVIVSAGAIKTPQLLMLSGIGPAKHLREFGIPVISDLPVGYNLQDHYATNLFFKIKDDTHHPPQTPNSNEIPPLVLGFATTHKGHNVPNYQGATFELAAGSPAAAVFCSSSFRYKDEICERLNQASQRNKILYSFVAHMQPKSRGRVSLRSRNPKDAPAVDLGYYKNEEDVDSMVEYIADFLRVTNTSHFKHLDAELLTLDECGCDNTDFQHYWRCYVFCLTTTFYNFVGTAPLGSVVDSRLQVRGVTRLRVADASVLPILPTADTAAPTIMVGEKAADMILHDFIM